MFCILKSTVPMFISRMSPFPILRLLGGIFIFFSNFNRTFCKQTEDPDAVSYLGLHCLLLSHKKDARLIWVVKLMVKKVILFLCCKFSFFDIWWLKNMEAYCRCPDNLSVQLGIYPIRFSSIAFFQKQLLKNIFLPHIYF